MARCDKASDEQAEKFAIKKDKILSLAKATWNNKSYKYLELVLDQLEMMTAYHSYGNGQIPIEEDPLWESLESEKIIYMINSLIKPELGIIVEDPYSFFPEALEFEVL